MIRIDRERLIEAGGAAVEAGLLCGRNVVLSGQVDELVPKARISNGGMVYFDGDGQLMQLHRGVDIHETTEQYVKRVPRYSLDLLVDDDGWFSNGISMGYINEDILRGMVLEKLNDSGLAIIGPIELSMVVPMMLWLNRMILLRGGFRYKVESIGNRQGDVRLLIWVNEKLEVSVDDMLVANFSEIASTMSNVESPVLGKGARLKARSKDNVLSLYEYQWMNWRSAPIDSGVYLKPGDKVLYWSYVDLSEIKGMGDIRKSFETMRRILEKDKGYKYVFTLTWLADWARALGMKRSSLPISRATMCEEVNAINTQAIDFMLSKRKSEGLASFVEATRRNKFNPQDVAYWYCPAREFGGRLLKSR